MGKAEKALNSIGIQTRYVKDGITELKTPSMVLGELAAQYEAGAISAEKMAIILEDVGSKRQADILAAMVKNWHLFEKSMVDFGEGTGTAATEAQKDLESWNGKLNVLSNTWTAFIAKTVDTQWIKTGMDGLTGLIKLFDNLGTSLLAISGVLLIIKKQQVSDFVINISKLGSEFSALGTKILSLIPGTAAHAAAQSAANTAMGAGTAAAAGLSAAIGILSLVISGVIIAYSAWARSQEETRQRNIESANAAAELSDSLFDLIGTYNELSNAVELDDSAKSTLIQTQDELLKLLDLENESIESLTEKYGSLTEAIRENVVEKLRDARRDIGAGVSATEQTVLSVASDGLMGGRNIINATGNESVRAFEALEKASIVSRGSYGSGGGALVLTGDDSTIDGAIANYEKLDAALKVLEESFTTTELSNNSLYQNLYDRYSEMRPAVEAYRSSIANLNENLAEEQVLVGLQGKELPKTKEEFDAFTQSIVNSAVSSGEFIGSAKEIENAIQNTLKSFPEFTRFFESDLPQVLDATAVDSAFNNLLDETREKINLLRDAMREQSETGQISADTYRAIYNSGEDYQKLLDETGDGLIVLTDETEKYIDELIGAAIQQSVLNEYSMEQIALLAELYSSVTDYNGQLDAMQSAYSTVATAIDEYNESGAVSVDTFQALLKLSPEYLAALDLENGKLVINEQAVLNLTEALKAEAIVKLQDAAVTDILAIANGDLESASTFAKDAVAKMGDEALAVGEDAAAGSAGVVAMAVATEAMNAAAEGVDLESTIGKQISAVMSAYNDAIGKISNLKIDFSTVGTSKKSSSKSGKDAHLEAYEKRVKELKFLRDMDIICEEEYYKRLEALADEYLKGREKYIDKYRAVQTEIYNYDQFFKDYQKHVKDIQFLRDMDIISATDYFDQLEHLADKYLKGQERYIEQYKDVLKELYNGRVKLAEEAYDKQKKLAEDSFKEEEKAAKKEYDLKKKLAEDEYKANKKAIENEYEFKKKLAEDDYKNNKKALDAQKDGLDDLLDSYKKLIDARKEALQRKGEAHDFDKDVAESNKRIANLQAQIEALSLDDSAKANAKRIDLQEKLNDEKADLEEKMYDQSIKRQQDALDDEFDRFKEHIDGQQKLLDDQLDVLKESHDQTMEILKSTHEATLVNIETTQTNLLDMLEKAHQATLENIENSQINMLDGLKSTLDHDLEALKLHFNSLVVEAQSAAEEIATAFDYVYAKGQNPSNVTAAQQQLVAGGYDVGKFGVDGKWGKDTEQAFVEAWQTYLNNLGAGLKIDGIRGPLTKAAEQKYGVVFPSYHTGGVVGNDIGTSDKKEIIELFNLSPDEVFAKLLKGEGVMTSDQMANLGGTLTKVQQTLLDTSKIAAVLGGIQSANHLSAMTDKVNDVSRVPDVNNTSNIVLEQYNDFRGVNPADESKLKKFADSIVERSKEAVAAMVVKGQVIGRGIPVTGRF